uniref:Uncharacterized protein n=1 Tax=Rangifer tarandus platyrhynchus TaxID=3082113 RepID=A0ACB0ERM6_RANTA|nr:unnamed protein product [Rangifer tarandus platyrhynchus]
MPSGLPCLRASSAASLPLPAPPIEKGSRPTPSGLKSVPGRPTQPQPSVPGPRVCLHLEMASGGSHPCSPYQGALLEPRPRAGSPRWLPGIPRASSSRRKGPKLVVLSQGFHARGSPCIYDARSGPSSLARPETDAETRASSSSPGAARSPARPPRAAPGGGWKRPHCGRRRAARASFSRSLRPRPAEGPNTLPRRGWVRRPRAVP